MTTHIFHEDVLTHGLSDDCPRCQEHLIHPWASLDSKNLSRLHAGLLYTESDRVAAWRLEHQDRTL